MEAHLIPRSPDRSRPSRTRARRPRRGPQGQVDLFFLGHGDNRLHGEFVLAFVGADGKVESITADTLVSKFKKHAKHGHLKEVVLMGCCTRPSASACALRPVSRSSSAGTRSFTTRRRPSSLRVTPRRARLGSRQGRLQAGEAAVEETTEPGISTRALKVAMYKFVAPEDRMAVYQRTNATACRTHASIRPAQGV